MTDLTSLYSNLLASGYTIDGGYLVTAIPGHIQHRLGINRDHYPIFFIQCNPDPSASRITGCNLELITVQFNRNCVLTGDSQVGISGIYSTVELKSGSPDLQRYFFEVVLLLLQSMPEDFTAANLFSHLHSIISLFSNLTAPPVKTIQGLWAELLVMDASKSPAVLANAWHLNNLDKFDFNDGKDKIEVKSTRKQRRIHRFSSEQLQPNKSSRLLIASVITIETHIGQNIHDLSLRIVDRISDANLSLLLKIKIAKVLGSSFEQAGEIYFDYAQAIDSLAYYNAEDVPMIAEKYIPTQIQNVSYDCDLTDLPEADTDKVESLLFAAI